jgi:nucleotide-binding universal stress UspA family protein
LTLRYAPLIRQTAFPVWFAAPLADPSRGVVAGVADAELPKERSRSERLDLDEEVLVAADSLGMLFDADVHLVQAYERRPATLLGPVSTGVLPSLHAVPGSLLADGTDARGGAAEREATLAGFARALGAGEAEVLAAPGNAADVLNASAKALEAGLIVMGAHDRSVWDVLLTGATAERTLAQADCDVLFVKADTQPQAEPAVVGADDSDWGAAEEVDLLVNPQRHFDRPAAVLRSSRLSPRQKMTVLRGWREELTTPPPAALAKREEPAPTAKDGRIREVQAALDRAVAAGGG